MKKLKWIAMALVLVLGMAAFAACKPDEPETPVFTVTYYDGTTVLKTEEVEEGGYATDWEPEAKEGMEFSDWYVDAGLNRVFDFEGEAITADRNLYAGYVAVGTDDTRTWAIVGSGQGDILSSSAWGTVITDVHALEKTEGENEFTITLDLYEDDQFQFATDTSWMNQRGFGYIPLADRTMTVDGEEVTPFSGGGGIGETADKQSNIIVEYPGNYTFTLTTYPDEDYYDDNVNNGLVSISNFDTITYEYNGPAAELSSTVTEFYIKGQDITQWGDMYNPATQMTRVGSTYTLTVYLKAGDQVMFTSLNVDRETGESTVGTTYINVTNLDEESASLFTAAGNNMTVNTSGEYTFTYDADSKTLSAALDEDATLVEADYYLDGSFGGLSWNQSFYDPDYKFAAAGNDVYTLDGIELAAGDEIVIQSFTQGATEESGEKLAAYNFRYYRGTDGAFEAADADNNNYNIAVVTAGTYNIEFDAYAKIITIVPADMQHTVYIKGSFVEGWKITDENGELIDDYKLEETSDGVFEITMTITDEMVNGATWQAGLQLDTTTGSDGTFIGAGALGEDAADNVNALFRPETGNNLTSTTAGTYRFVYDLNTGELNIYEVTA
ncbi:MAG TPA: SusF/SusE family outer membrane protein [Candidatus Gallimonas intestinavium]|uniref:SusF/SusE family outer membrane protein n=1 Tax=Candidatus Gallimonas intestinavium TaxID=2838603 RepID=A0A9D2G4J6_9FIRM|nr:SusF/SusE family outer membrane protein [Candidatus Gallimonas intestinavium]